MKTTLNVNEILEQSRLRGAIRGTFDMSDGIYNPAPLSGEWAGESFMEILGDLIDSWDGVSDSDMDIDEYAILDDACGEYESGYDCVFDANDHARAIRDAVIEGMI